MNLRSFICKVRIIIVLVLQVCYGEPCQRTLVRRLECSINIIFQAQCQAFDMSGSSILHHTAKVGIIIHVLQIRKQRQKCYYTESKWQNWDLNLRSNGLHSPNLFLFFYYIMLVPMTFMHWKCNFFFFSIGLLQQKNHHKQSEREVAYIFCVVQNVEKGSVITPTGAACCSGKQHVWRKEIQMAWAPSPFYCYLAVCSQNHRIVASEKGLQHISEATSHFTDGEIH